MKVETDANIANIPPKSDIIAPKIDNVEKKTNTAPNTSIISKNFNMHPKNLMTVWFLVTIYYKYTKNL